MSDDICPLCGALPCDQTSDPLAKPHDRFLENLGYILTYHAGDDPASVWKRIVEAMRE